jgi:hypothetical protein
MIDTVWVDDSHGLSLNEGPHPHRDNENGVLFYLEYILLKEAQGQDISDDVAEFKHIVENIRTYDGDSTRLLGLYDRGAGESLNPDKDSIRVISHDNLTAIAAFDARYGDGSEADKIAKWGLLHGSLYDNAYPHKPRLKTIQWPTDLMFWAMSSGKWYYAPLVAAMFPFFALRCVLSDLGQPNDTSGKLLNFVRFASYRDKGLLALPMKLLWKWHVARMKSQYGDNWIHQIMVIYFQNPNHPNRSLSDNVKF